jgi:hypothetical protein
MAGSWELGAGSWELGARQQGARSKEQKKGDKSDVHLPQPPEISSYLLYFIFIFIFVFLRFWAFRNKGSSKTR